MSSPTVLVCTAEGMVLWDLRSSTVLCAYKDSGTPSLRAVASVPSAVCRGQPPWPCTFAVAQSGLASVLQYSWGQDSPLYRCAVSEPLCALAASPDGSLLVGGGASGRLYLWESSTGELAREWQGHYKAASCLAFTPCGSLLASGGLDGVAHCWDVAGLLDVSSASSAPPSASATWAGHTMALTHLAFTPLSGLSGSPSASRLVTCSLDRSVRWWDVASQRALHTATLPTGATTLCPDSSGGTWFVGCLDGSIHVLGGGGEGSAALPGGHTAAVTCLALTPDGDRLLSGGDDGSVRVWSVASRQQVGTLGSASAAAAASAAASPSSHSVKRTSIAALLLLATRPPALLQQGRAGSSGSSSSSSSAAAPHQPLPLPAVQPLRKHVAYTAGSSSSSSSSGGGPRLAVLRLQASAGHEEAEGLDAAMHAAYQQLEAVAAAAAAATAVAGSGSAVAVPAAAAAAAAAADSSEAAELRSKVAALEAENARWKAVAGKLLGKA